LNQNTELKNNKEQFTETQKQLFEIRIKTSTIKKQLTDKHNQEID